MKLNGCMYACDRAEKAHESGEKPRQFVEEGSKAAEGWREIAWTDANGVARKMLVCPECAEKYASLEKTHQRDMEEFENEGLI